MKLLIITYSYFPDLTPRAFRWSSIVEYLTSQGHQIDVVCAWKPGLPRTEKHNGANIYRVGNISVILIRNFAKYNQTQTKELKHRFLRSLLQNSLQLLSWVIKLLYRYTWKQIYWPDYACLWYFPARQKAGKLLRTYKYNALITISHPFTAHLVGLSLSRTFPSLYWLVDIGDPFCFSDLPLPNNKIYRNLNYAAEKQVFNRARAIVVTTKPTFDKYAELFPDNKLKMKVIPALAIQKGAWISQKPFFPERRKIRLIFSGTLYRNLRNPKFVLQVFAKLLEIDNAGELELHFFGNIGDCEDYFTKYRPLIGNKIFIHGVVERNQVLNAMAEADILVNIGNNTPYQLPSKVLEYASFGKPILNFVKIFNDCSIPFFNEYPAALCLYENEATLSMEQIKNVYCFINQKHIAIDDTALHRLLGRYRIETIGKEYNDLISGPANLLFNNKGD